ncbi:hypothetical protein F2Q69_00054752 [Brassica cretica]|uniref:Uncharacterized protein n=1 Tax=Brassica cretica TaxID=69181 RepID=A0A8S9NCT9_BRACR|nr:hypothetical protein F2Q69_00054752 [Brassica cretica]
MIVTRKLCPDQSVQGRQFPLSSSGSAVRNQSVQACQFLHYHAEVLSKSSRVQSSQVFHWVLAKSSPINQLLIGIEHCGLVLFEFHLELRCETRPCKACFGMDLCFLGLVFSGFKETPYSLDREDSERRSHGLWLSIRRRCNVAMTRRTVGYRAVTRWIVGRCRLKVPSSGLLWPDVGLYVFEGLLVALGMDDRIAGYWTLGSPV